MHSSSSHKRSFQLGLLQPAPAWTAILGLVLFSALCLLVRTGGILRLAFPAGSFAVGIFLYWRYPVLYLGFTWWVWFLTPLLRRLVDHQSGWVNPSPILLAPLLVTLVTVATFVRYLPKSYHQGGLPFILCFVSVFYGFLVGMIRNSPTTAAAISLLGWLAPIFFGFHLFVNWRDYPYHCQNIQRTFLWGTLVMGIYGMLQYLTAPEWDRFWMINALNDTGLNSIGSPEPLGIRVFSTMNSPQPFATVMLAGLVLIFTSYSKLRFLAAGTGYLAFLLSSARSAWIGWFVGLLLFIYSLKASLQIRLIVTILLAAIIVLLFATTDPFSTAIVPRIQSLISVSEDISFKDRSEGYRELLGIALSEFLGWGMGKEISHSGIGSNDSGILSLFLSLGWIGTVPYVSGIILASYNLFRGSESRFDLFASAARAIALGILAQIGLNHIMAGSTGVVLWGFLGVGMAARKYYWHQYSCQTALNSRL